MLSRVDGSEYLGWPEMLKSNLEEGKIQDWNLQETMSIKQFLNRQQHRLEVAKRLCGRWSGGPELGVLGCRVLRLWGLGVSGSEGFLRCFRVQWFPPNHRLANQGSFLRLHRVAVYGFMNIVYSGVRSRRCRSKTWHVQMSS